MQYPATSKYDERGFAPPLTPGDYTITLVDISDTDDNGKPRKNNKDFPICRFEFDVKGYPDNKLFEFFCFAEDNPHANIQLGKFKQFLMACGVSTDEPGEPRSLVGKSCTGYVKTREYQGRTYNNIGEFKPTHGAGEDDAVGSDDDDDAPF